MTQQLQQTVDLTPTIHRADGHSELDDSILELQNPGASANVTRQFGESTRILLRQRLMIACCATLGLLLSIKAAGLLFGELTVYELVTRSLAIAVLAGSSIFLYRKPSVSIFALRIVEAVVGIALAFEFTWILILETQKILQGENLDSAGFLLLAVCFVMSIIIAIYGMFIPNDWRRTGAVTFVTAVLPLIAASVLRQVFPDLKNVENFPGFVAPTLTLGMAAIATYASYVVHDIRRQVEAAKQYGQYQLLEEIGRGAMGIVYKGKHRMLKRPAAIKLIRTEVASDPEMIANFENEVQLSAELNHWNSVQIYDYGRTEQGDFYYVMEFLEGESLLERIEDQGKLSCEETVQIIIQVCDGLQEAHFKGMVHRDIKPANLFLAKTAGQRDIAKILDFGLAAMKTEKNRLQSLSGTPAYISPEQIQSKEIDERADIYALGCVIFECLTGRPLFAGTTVKELLIQHVSGQPDLSNVPPIPEDFRDVIEMCIAKKPENRFRNVLALKNALENCLTNSK